METSVAKKKTRGGGYWKFGHPIIYILFTALGYDFYVRIIQIKCGMIFSSQHIK